MKKYAISRVCRVDAPTVDRIMEYIDEQIHGQSIQTIIIPPNVLQPRMISFDPIPRGIVHIDANIPCYLKPHRDSLIPCVSIKTANEMIKLNLMNPKYEDQFALIYPVNEYLADNQILEDEKISVKDSGAEIVFVAVVGETRSLLATIRNMFDGQQPIEREGLVKAFNARNMFLIENSN